MKIKKNIFFWRGLGREGVWGSGWGGGGQGGCGSTRLNTIIAITKYE